LEKKLTDYILLKAAERYLERMQPEDQLRIIKVLDALLLNPALLDIKPLKGRSELRLRVGKYRILFIEDRENEVYLITQIGSCGDIYK
jgi:mRNA interferase RelE/StbE